MATMSAAADKVAAKSGSRRRAFLKYSLMSSPLSHIDIHPAFFLLPGEHTLFGKRGMHMPKRRESGKMRSAADMIKKINALDSSRKYSQVHVEFFGRREASIDGLYGVLEYDGERIRLSAGKEEIVFCGKGLSIDVFDLGQAVIHGEIMSMEFCK
ncbi:MAG TPA: hypothetical protein DEF14_03410 [Ruminococcaceae bacterium]|nr:hypothetical protein [Oscillospiraceae bacterium]HBW72850.1 hypothetical protein [Oscillospiraceae bacterium]